MDFTKLIPTDNEPAAPAPVVEAPLVQEESKLEKEHENSFQPPAEQSQPPNTPTVPPVDAPAAPTPPAVDYNAYLDEMSGGAIKDQDGFKAVLPKIKDYDTLKVKYDELTAEMAKAPKFADDEVRILNDLKLAGASKEQLATFTKINSYPAVSEMSDKDAIVASMVMKGTKESVAIRKVDNQYKLGAEDLDEHEREDLDDDLRLAAKAAREDLDKIKAKVSEVSHVPAEEIRLQQEANLRNHQAAVRPYAKEVADSLQDLGTFTLVPAKDKQPAVTWKMPIDDGARTFINQSVENYFMDGNTPVTPENTIEAMAFARAELFRTNPDKYFQMVDAAAVSRVTKQLVDKYENRSGLKQPGDNPIQQTNSEAETANWFGKKVSGRA